MAMVSVKLVKSLIGTKPNQRKTVEALGLKKVGHTVEKEMNPQIRGMITVVQHLVDVKEI